MRIAASIPNVASLIQTRFSILHLGIQSGHSGKDKHTSNSVTERNRRKDFECT